MHTKFNSSSNLKILGFSTIVEDVPALVKKVNALTSDNEVIQLLNAEGIAGEKHIIHAFNQSIVAFSRGENIANDLGLEICVRASAQRQISKALKLLGLKAGFNKICALLVNCNREIEDELILLLEKRDAGILKPDKEILKNLYQISDAEIESAGGITRVMLERTSALVLET